MACTATLGPFQPTNFSFLSSSSSVAMKNFSNSSSTGWEYVPNVLNSLLGVRATGHSKQTVVPLGFIFTPLLNLENADDPAGND